MLTIGASLASSASPPALPTDVPMAGANFDGAPPAFQVPAGGSISVTATGFGKEFVLKRPDGSLFASADVDLLGRTFRATFYDASGSVFVTTYQTYPEVLHTSSARSLTSALVPNRNRRLASNCGAATWNDTGNKWTSSITWLFNSGSTPSGLNVNTTETYIRNAHAEWFNNTNGAALPTTRCLAWPMVDAPRSATR